MIWGEKPTIFGNTYVYVSLPFTDFSSSLASSGHVHCEELFEGPEATSSKAQSLNNPTKWRFGVSLWRKTPKTPEV